MTHQDTGHYGAKHPHGKIDPAIAEEIRRHEDQGRITCAAAHAIAVRLGCPPAQVGMTIDLLEKRIHRCQLGLFGYGEKGKAVTPATSVQPLLEAAIRDALEGNRITCKAAWEVADRLNLPRLEVACACQALGVKVSVCQIGAF